jgi:signal transduction histidine kinase
VSLGVVDPAQAVRDAASLAGRMRADVTVRVDTTYASRLVLADPTLVDQVVMNLCVNAMDAMPGGGPLEVRVSDRDRGGAPGVRIEVEDSGTGIAPELLERIFEPFFTTKPAGIGTGLGLSTVHGIVHQLGGAVDVRSTIGAGSCFGVWLPAGPRVPDETAGAAQS